MALHPQLPIYKVAYDLLALALDLAKNMPRDVKPLLGAKLGNECMELLVLVFRANAARHKTPHLDQLLERLQVTELLLRVSRDRRVISTGQYAGAIALTAAIGKQANGWRKASAPAV